MLILFYTLIKRHISRVMFPLEFGAVSMRLTHPRSLPFILPQKWDRKRLLGFCCKESLGAHNGTWRPDISACCHIGQSDQDRLSSDQAWRERECD